MRKNYPSTRVSNIKRALFSAISVQNQRGVFHELF